MSRRKNRNWRNWQSMTEELKARWQCWGLSTKIVESIRRKTSLPLLQGRLGFLSSLGILRNQKLLLLENLGKGPSYR